MQSSTPSPVVGTFGKAAADRASSRRRKAPGSFSHAEWALAKIFAKAHAAWLKEPGAFRRRDDALAKAAFPKVPTTGEGVELCILLSASPASNPRETWSAAKQRQKGHSDQWSARPAALYPFKRRQWFDLCFADEPLVRAAAPFGALASDYRADEGGEE